MREEVPQGAHLSEEGGCDRYLGNARIDPATFSVGLPLGPVIVNLKSEFRKHLSVSHGPRALLEMIAHLQMDRLALDSWAPGSL